MGIPNINVTNQSPGISTNLTTRQKISSSWPSTDQARMTPITDWLLSPSGLRNLTPSTPLVSVSKVTVKIFSPPCHSFSPYSWSVLPVSLYFVYFLISTNIGSPWHSLHSAVWSGRRSQCVETLVRPGCPT